MAETMNGLKRTSYCGKLSKANVGNSEVVCGWVQKQRDKGHLIFIDPARPHRRGTAGIRR